jgi:hypothetical protein
MSLTFSVRNNPGQYALLLGSGTSTEAGMPTGWAVVSSLIKPIKVRVPEFHPLPELTRFK